MAFTIKSIFPKRTSIPADNVEEHMRFIGTNIVNSWRARYKIDPFNKVQEGEYIVWEYPDKFRPVAERLIKRHFKVHKIKIIKRTRI